MSKPSLDAMGIVFNGYRVLFAWDSLARNVKLTTLFYLLPRGRMNESVLLLPSSLTQGQVYFTLLYQECYFLSDFLDQKCFQNRQMSRIKVLGNRNFVTNAE